MNSLSIFAWPRRIALWFWNEPRFLVRFWSSLAVLSLIAALIWWLS